ncbi:MAG TPA: ABC transporter permease [Thermodesulfovibrionales bacterium]|nr:ABC transporter permease [Thermodesulfovibrionales bacterium]
MTTTQRFLRYIPVLGAVAVWQLLSSVGILPENRLPSPLQIVHGLAELLSHGLPPGFGLIGHCFASLKRVLCGVAAATITALPFGIVMGYSARMRDYLTPFVELLRPIPPLAWVPIAILWFGIGDQSASFIIFLGAFFPVLLNTVGGVLSISRRLIESSVILGATKTDLFRKVLFPGALPSIITGIRISLGIGWMTLVAAEFTGVRSGYGLGYMIMTARDIQRPDQIIAGMVVIGLIGYAMDLLIRTAEARLLKWR